MTDIPGTWHGMPPEQRFWATVQIPEDRGQCWIWLGAESSGGYGQLWANGRSTRAHRYSWELHNKSIPDGLCVLHKCDNRVCVNPAHLFLGTQKDNTTDMWEKGRARGPAAVGAASSSCHAGHPFDDANTYRSGGRRHCRACKRERNKERRAQRRLNANR